MVRRQREIRKRLGSLFWTQQRVLADLRRLELMRREAMSPGAVDYSKQIIHGGIPKTLGDKAVYLIDFEDRLKDAVRKRNAEVAEVLNTIDAVEDEKLQLLLTLRYREFLPWEEIAKQMHYSWPQIHRLHDAALKAAENAEALIQHETK